MIYQTYKGARLDLEAYKGKATIDYEIEVDYYSGAEFDFSIYDSVVMEIKYRKHGEVVLTPTVTTDENFVIVGLTIAQTAALQTREYWYEIYGVFSNDEEELITFGILKVT